MERRETSLHLLCLSPYYILIVRASKFMICNCYAAKSDLTSVPKNLFDIFLVDSKITTSSNASIVYCDVHPVSVMSLLIGWCQSTSLKA
jgi:hypothetical protein